MYGWVARLGGLFSGEIIYLFIYGGGGGLLSEFYSMLHIVIVRTSIPSRGE